MLTLVSICIDRLNKYNSAAEFEEFAGEEAGEAWKDILNLLYELLGNRIVHTRVSEPKTSQNWNRDGLLSCQTPARGPTLARVHMFPPAV